MKQYCNLFLICKLWSI